MEAKCVCVFVTYYPNLTNKAEDGDHSNVQIAEIRVPMLHSVLPNYQKLRQDSKFTQRGWISLEVVDKMYLENGQEQVKTLERSRFELS